jgi:hypothetical protein
MFGQRISPITEREALKDIQRAVKAVSYGLISQSESDKRIALIQMKRREAIHIENLRKLTSIPTCFVDPTRVQ